MKWRDIIIGACVTLFVTAVGGIIVYYATKEPKITKQEKLVYVIEEPTMFASPTSSFCLQNIRLANFGNLPAEQITLGIVMASSFKISDKHISMSSGLAGTYSIQKEEDSNLVVTVPILTPNEVITTSLMLDGKEKPSITVSAKSKNTVAKKGELVRENKNQDKKEVSRFLEYLLPLIAILQIPIFLTFLPRVRKFLYKRFPGGIKNSSPQSLNNTAFLFIHGGMVDEASDLIENEIRSKGADTYLLANQALCYAIKGDFEPAAKRVRAAYFYGRTNHEKAVVLFNRSLISFLKGDEDIAEQDIRKAIAMSTDAISDYCQFSTVVAELSEKFKSLREICNECGVEFQSEDSGEKP